MGPYRRQVGVMPLGLDEDAEEDEVVMEEVVLGPTPELILHQFVTRIHRTVNPLFMYPKHG